MHRILNSASELNYNKLHSFRNFNYSCKHKMRSQYDVLVVWMFKYIFPRTFEEQKKLCCDRMSGLCISCLEVNMSKWGMVTDDVLAYSTYVYKSVHKW